MHLSTRIRRTYCRCWLTIADHMAATENLVSELDFEELMKKTIETNF